ncbi:hypothetical protein GH714_000635 [Hevea brasiliensis]|uniref:Transcription factor CBF/NF-Y/archaeal histone domain-containing protein n=1 Tax=Hevea brasiliensis TaxID=3981 RepID=A0A6A6LMK1_HEVBR|nr:hypothetical protein GH714_000635 [Hevea brasiliensis]
MDASSQQAQSGSYMPQAPTSGAPAPPAPTPFHHLLQQQQQQLQMFWSYQRQEIEQVNDFKNHQLPLARIKKIMKADEDVRMISAEAPILFAKACELFILELTIRDEIKDEAGLGGMVGATASGVPYYYPPMGHPAGAGPGGMMIGRPAVDPTGVYVQPPSQAWQSVWQTAAAEDVSYGSGGSSGQGNLDGQGVWALLYCCDDSVRNGYGVLFNRDFGPQCSIGCRENDWTECFRLCV